MNTGALVIRELSYRRFGFFLGCLAAAAAVGCIVGALTLLDVHDASSQAILAEKQKETAEHMAQLSEDMRKATLLYGLNLVILPKDQDVTNWYGDHTATKYMDESDADKLATSDIITINHILPNLQQQVKWPEKDRRIILIGTRGEVMDLHKNPKAPIVQPVPKGTIVLGYELHTSMGIKKGDEVVFMGKTLKVHNTHYERGNADDITAWVYLADAQELLDKPGRINSILALQCLCKGPDLSYVRKDIAGILPNTKVLELGAEDRLARAETRASVAREAKAALERETILRANMRNEREKLASILVTVVVAAAGLWLWLLSTLNVRHRNGEIGIFRAMGMKSSKILVLFLTRSFVVGLIGGIVGTVLGVLTGRFIAVGLEDIPAELADAPIFGVTTIVLGLVIAPALSVAAGWLPAMVAATKDPADVLRGE